MNYKDIERRVGCFAIPEIIIKQYAERVASIFQKMIVIRAEFRYYDASIHYEAMSPIFDETGENEKPREYHIVFHEDGQGEVYRMDIALSFEQPKPSEQKKINFREFL